MSEQLMAITPEKWSLLVELDEENLINIQPIESAVHNLALNRIEVAEEYYSIAKHLLDNDLHYRSTISRAYYGMYHAARGSV